MMSMPSNHIDKRDPREPFQRSTIIFTSQQIIERQLQRFFPEHKFSERVEFFQSIDSLRKRIRKPIHDLGIIVLIVSSQEELQGLLKLKKQLRELRIIISLPSQNPEVMSHALKLFPRFVFDSTLSLWDLAAIIHKMNEKPT